MNQPLPSAIAEQDFAAGYEQLRQHALGRTSTRIPGLALLLRQGLAAWIQACSCGASSPSRAPGPPANAVAPLSADVRSQAALILAGILMHSRSEMTV